MNADEELTISAMTQFLLASMNHQKDVRQIEEFISKYSVGHLINLTMQAPQQHLGESFKLAAIQLMEKLVVKYVSERTNKCYGGLRPIDDILNRYITKQIKRNSNKHLILQALRQIEIELSKLQQYEKGNVLVLINELKNIQKWKISKTINEMATLLENTNPQQFTPRQMDFIFSNLITIVMVNFSYQSAYFSLICLQKIIDQKTVNTEAIQLVVQWMPLMKRIMIADDPQINSKISECDRQNTEQYYYFHAKQENLKALYKLFFKQGSKNYHLNQIVKIKAQLFASQSSYFLSALISLFTRPLTALARFYHLDRLTIISQNLRIILQPYADKLQYELILPFVGLTQVQAQMMINDRDDLHIKQFQERKQYVSSAAVNLWCSLTRQDGPETRWDQNINFILHLLESNKQKDKEIAFSLLKKACQNYRRQYFISNIFEGYFMKEFPTANNLFKNQMLNYFIWHSYGLLSDASYYRQVFQELFKAIRETSITLIQRKCCILICSLGFYKTAIQEIKQNMDTLIKVMQFELMSKLLIQEIFHSIYLLISLNCTQYKKYAIGIFGKIIDALTDKDQKQFDNDYCELIEDSIVNIASQTALMLENYSDCLIYEENLVKLLSIRLLLPFIQVEKIFKNYILKSYQICKSDNQKYTDLWKNIILYQISIQQQFTQEPGQNTIIKFYYLRINITLIQVLKQQTPLALLENILIAHSKLQSSLSIIIEQEDRKLEYLSFKLFGLFLLYFPQLLHQRQLTVRFTKTVVHYLMEHLDIIPAKGKNIFILIINHILRQKSVSHYFLSEIFKKLIRVLIDKTNQLLEQSYQPQNNDDFDIRVQRNLYAQIQYQECCSIIEALMDYQRTIHKICSEDHQLYLILVSKVSRGDLERVNNSVSQLTKNLI